MNLNHWIDHWAEVAPDRPAIIFGDQQYSYSSLASATARLAAVFRHEFGIKEGDRVAFVVTTETSRLDQDGVQALFKNRLARFKHPQRVMLVDKLPRNAMGKVEKFELRKQIARDQE